ncbi:hypothetical protein [Caproiciproducens sp.]
MSKIYAPNEEYTGVSASVAFSKGVGETDNPALLDWFRSHGYKVEETENFQVPQEPGKSPDEMTVAELKAYAKEKNIDLGDSTKKEDILAKIKGGQQ